MTSGMLLSYHAFLNKKIPPPLKKKKKDKTFGSIKVNLHSDIGLNISMNIRSVNREWHKQNHKKMNVFH